MTEVIMRRNGRYLWPPTGENTVSLPSVTTITGLLDKSGALAGSAAKITATWAVEHLDQWENLAVSEAERLIKRQYREEWSHKAAVGSRAHKVIADWASATKAGEGAPELSDIDMLPYLAGATSFIDDHVTKIGAVEATVFNLTYQYAGTLDMLAKLSDGTYAVIDWKTGNVYEEASLQLSAYVHAQFIGRPDGTQIMLDRPISRAIAVQLPGDGTYTTFETDYPCGGKCEPRKECGTFRGFVALRSTQRWIDEQKPTSWTRKQGQKHE